MYRGVYSAQLLAFLSILCLYCEEVVRYGSKEEEGRQAMVLVSFVDTARFEGAVFSCVCIAAV